MYLAPISRKGTHNGQTAEAETIPPPVLGLNTKDPLPFLKPGYAVVLDNWWTTGNELQTRRGAEDVSVTFGNPANDLAVYYGVTGQKLMVLFPTGTAVLEANGTTSGFFADFKGPAQTINFSTAAGHFLVCVNGIDNMHVYNGTTWTEINDTSTPAMTGVVTSLLDKVAMHQKRLWFAEKNTLNAWYLEPELFAGTAAKFALGSVFTRGGTIAAIFTWSVDSGAGQDDLLCFYTTNGEIAVYQGIDPSSPDTWALVGVYYVGEPVKGAPVEKFGGDVVLVTVRGIFLLSQALQSNSLSNRFVLTDAINPTFQAIAQLYGSTEGWSINVLPNLDMMLVSTPAGQFAANVTTKSWHRFIGWKDVKNVVIYNQLPYFLKDGGGHVARGWVGTTDYGEDIVSTAVQAPNRLRRSFSQKLASMIRPNLLYSSAFLLRAGIVADNDFNPPLYDYSVGNQANVGIWDASDWNEAVWGGGVSPYTEWFTTPQDPALWLAPALQVIGRGDIVRWTSTDILFEAGSII